MPDAPLYAYRLRVRDDVNYIITSPCVRIRYRPGKVLVAEVLDDRVDRDVLLAELGRVADGPVEWIENVTRFREIEASVEAVMEKAEADAVLLPENDQVLFWVSLLLVIEDRNG